MKRIVAILLGAVLSCAAVATENVQFLSKPLSAGKAMLTEDGFLVPHLLGTANFSPELRFPIQLIYRSTSEKTGLFGFGWSSPQLESTAYYDRDGVLWTTPWGEQIKFFPKDAEEPEDAIRLELYEQAKKGRGFFAPYSDWEADTSASAKELARSGDWTFTGKRQYRGWQFIYREGKLRSISAPGGRTLRFEYSKGRLSRIEQDGVAFVELSGVGGRISAMTINGVETNFRYREEEVVILPKTAEGKLVRARRPRLYFVRTGELNPLEFSYKDGFLSRIRQGNRIDSLTVQTETEAERIANLRSRDRKSGVKHSGKVAGRLLADAQYEYRYPENEPGRVVLVNRLNQTAEYDYAKETGIFKIREFSGRRNTIYYFMRYDVAYLGKVRKIVDGRGRDVISYRYDKLTGNVVRIRDMAGNDLNFSYDAKGNLVEVSRRAAEQEKPEPVTAFRYDSEGNRTAISMLNADGKAVMTTALQYDRNRQPVLLFDGQRRNSIRYNDFGYPEEIRNVFGQSSRFHFDRFNRLERAEDNSGVTTFYTYNATGRVERIERRDGEMTLTSLEIAYDGNGLPVAYIDQAGREKKFERDAFGRVVKELFPDETQVEYTYNPLGRLASVLDQNQNYIRFEWNRFGLDAKTTQEGQLTDYVHDRYGLLARIDSRWKGKTDRSVRYRYDKFDRLVSASYGEGEEERFDYDSWGRLIASARGERKAEFRYDYFGRLVEKREGDVTTTYSYNAWGQRTGRTTRNGSLTLAENRTYDRFGRLVEIESGEKKVRYLYNDRNQLSKQVINGVPVEYTYTRYGQLESKVLGGAAAPVASLKYFYSRSGEITGRMVDGELQKYTYDRRGQLLQVADAQGRVRESYVYDPTGNILQKTVDGKTTQYTYDKANQLVSSTCGEKTKYFAYDAAGRLVKEGTKSYNYSYMDKVRSVSENGAVTASFTYDVDGQIATAKTHATGKQESFLWDGLALIHRGGTSYINEPYVTGGNPILAEDKVLFNDMLGTTLGVHSEKYEPIARDAFGMTSKDADSAENFFTGKPYIGELGYAFLFRNYRPEQGKWQTSDPLGYPDGWNNLAYVNNGVTTAIDWLGASCILFHSWEDIPGSTSETETLVKVLVSHTFTCGGASQQTLTYSENTSVSISFQLQYQGTGIPVSYTKSFNETRSVLVQNIFPGDHNADDEHETRGSYTYALELYVVTQTKLQKCADCNDVQAVVESAFFRTKDKITNYKNCVLE